MGFDWGSFSGGVVGVFGVYGVFLLQRREDRKKALPEKKRKHFVLTTTVTEAIYGLYDICVLDKTDSTIEKIVEYMTKTIDFIKNAQIQNTEIEDEKIGMLLDKLLLEIGKMVVDIHKAEDKEAAIVQAKLRCGELFAEHSEIYKAIKEEKSDV